MSWNVVVVAVVFQTVLTTSFFGCFFALNCCEDDFFGRLDDKRVLFSSTILTPSKSSNLYIDKLNWPMISMESEKNEAIADSRSVIWKRLKNY